jgi:hypothetical protein
LQIERWIWFCFVEPSLRWPPRLSEVFIDLHIIDWARQWFFLWIYLFIAAFLDSQGVSWTFDTCNLAPARLNYLAIWSAILASSQSIILVRILLWNSVLPRLFRHFSPQRFLSFLLAKTISGTNRATGQSSLASFVLLDFLLDIRQIVSALISVSVIFFECLPSRTGLPFILLELSPFSG